MISESELQIVKKAETHLESLYALLALAGRKEEADKSLWLDIKELRRFIKAHGG